MNCKSKKAIRWTVNPHVYIIENIIKPSEAEVFFVCGNNMRENLIKHGDK